MIRAVATTKPAASIARPRRYSIHGTAAPPSFGQLLAALERVRPAAAEKKAAAEAKRIAREAEEEARAARALQDAAELGEGKGAPVEPEAKGGAADDFEGRAIVAGPNW